MMTANEHLVEETRLLTCPVRGKLSASSLAKDGITPSEESRRIEFIKLLIQRGYPIDQIAVETVIIRNLGESGRMSLFMTRRKHYLPEKTERTGFQA